MVSKDNSPLMTLSCDRGFVVLHSSVTFAWFLSTVEKYREKGASPNKTWVIKGEVEPGLLVSIICWSGWKTKLGGWPWLYSKIVQFIRGHQYKNLNRYLILPFKLIINFTNHRSQDLIHLFRCISVYIYLKEKKHEMMR